jgi:hypothetical protein
VKPRNAVHLRGLFDQGQVAKKAVSAAAQCEQKARVEDFDEGRERHQAARQDPREQRNPLRPEPVKFTLPIVDELHGPDRRAVPLGKGAGRCVLNIAR